MRESTLRLFLGLSFALGTAACSKAKPKVSLLDPGAVPQPLFGGLTEVRVSANSDQQSFPISGQCDRRIHDLQLEKSGQSNASFQALASLTIGATQVTCAANGQFSFTLRSLSDLGYVAVESQTYEVLVRGVTKGGFSRPSTIKIFFSTPNGNSPKRMVITSGATESTATGERYGTSAFNQFRAQIRADFRLIDVGTSPVNADQVQQGSRFQMRIGSGATAN